MFIDQLVRMWLDWRTDMAAKRHPELQLKSAALDADGFFEGTFVSPAIAALAEEASRMLNAAHAQNYIEFDMLPRAGSAVRSVRSVRVTVQWANGTSPAARAAQLKDDLDAALAVVQNQAEEIGRLKTLLNDVAG